MNDVPTTAAGEIALRIEALIDKRNYHLTEEQHSIQQAKSHQEAAARINALALDYQRLLDDQPAEVASVVRELARRRAREREVGAPSE
jgi:hypothetical protein